MLFDLRVVLAACLATFIFVAVGLGLMSGVRSPFKAAAEGPRFAGPGLPQALPLPLPDAARSEEVTGTIADLPATSPAAQIQESAQEKAQGKAEQAKAEEHAQEKARPKARETRTAPAKGSKKQTITSLIQEDAAGQPAAPAKPKAKRRRAHPKAKQPPPSTNPFTAFMNNNTNRPAATAPGTVTR